MVLLCHPLYRIKCIIKKVRLNLLMKNLKLCFSFIFLFFVYNAKKFINFFYHCIKRISQLPYFEDVDVIQVGARNMQNFELLKELGKIRKPILLKRGLANTLDELLMSAEYIMAGGNENVILCERGIRTFETSTRNTLDISAIPMLKQKTHLPVIVDPSHASGIRFMVEPLALAAIAAGADGLMIEVHNDPEKALCDGAQSLTPQMFDTLMKKIQRTVDFFRILD